MHLPTAPLQPGARPDVLDRAGWEAASDALLDREKAHTREGDAIAAARRRLPMTEVPPGATVVGPGGTVPFTDVFEGRSLLVAYFHMWHDDQPWQDQCPGCTFSTAQIQLPEYLNARDVTLAVCTEGEYEQSAAYARFMGYRLPWYSARGSADLVAGRPFGFIACYLRDGDRAFETYWTTGRGTEVLDWSYGVLDLTAYGRQEPWEESPDGWPVLPPDQQHWRVAGRPTAQWAVTDEPVDGHPDGDGAP